MQRINNFTLFSEVSNLELSYVIGGQYTGQLAAQYNEPIRVTVDPKTLTYTVSTEQQKQLTDYSQPNTLLSGYGGLSFLGSSYYPGVIVQFAQE
jgi:hypothetical protein